MDFNDFEWHDSAIRNIRIDRTRPGKQDTIEFEQLSLKSNLIMACSESFLNLCIKLHSK